MVTGRHRRRQWCRPRQSSVGCARRRPIAAPEDAGSIPATSKSGSVANMQAGTLLEVRRHPAGRQKATKRAHGETILAWPRAAHYRSPMLAAIVASLIGAVAVVVGVWLSQRLSTSAQLGRELNQRVRSIQEIQLSLVSVTDGPKGPIDAEWTARSSQLTLELTELRSFATALSADRRRNVDRAADHFSLL